jgi:glutaminyl-peptide cyclotransferase
MSTPEPSGAARPAPSTRAWVLVAGAVVAAVVASVLLLAGRGEQAAPAAARTLDAGLAAARRTDPAVPAATARRFDADRALRLVRLQLAAGPRPSGSAALERVRQGLLARLPRGQREPVAGHPGLFNLVGTIPGRGPAIVLAAHYDTQLEPAGFVGANDSAAGTAVVLEAARALSRARRPAGAREVRFVLLDGEELPPGGNDARFAADGLRGSKAYAAAHDGQLDAVVVADYVAGRGLRLPREPGSDEGLWARVRAAARGVGVGRVFAGTGRVGIVDDHLPFLERGIPAVDLIDWDYAPKQTARDTLDRLSARAIDATGETVVAWLLAERRRR